jgi:uncharacterized protein (TIGR03435 family)
MLRSIVVAMLAGICTWRMQNVARRHAVWTAVLAIMMLMPLADRIVPSASAFSTLGSAIRAVPMFTLLDSESNTVPPVYPPTASKSLPPPSPNWDRWTIVAIAFAVINFVFAFQMIFAHLKLRKIRHASRPVYDRRCDIAIVQLCESEAVTVPLTIGWLKPMVILPSDWRTWEEWKLRAVLAHEMAHVRRGDWAIEMIAALNTVMCWYNPLSWWLERRLAVLCEEACDEASVSVVGNPACYAEVLLQFAANQAGGRLRVGSVAMARRNIASRIERILVLSRPESGFLTRTAWTIVLALAIPVLYAASSIRTTSEAAAVPQQTAPMLRFEVASVKPSGAGPNLHYEGDCQGIDSSAHNRTRPGRRLEVGLGHCVFRSIPQKALVSEAYSPVSFGGRLGFPWNQIEQAEGLGWIGSEPFDIEAKTEDASAATEDQLFQMLQQLLADRFKLKFHLATKEVSGYVMQVAPAGLKLREATGKEMRAGMGGGPPSGGFMAGEAVPISALATFLSQRLGRPIQDETALTGLYNWELSWAPDESEFRLDGIPVTRNAPDPGPSLVKAVREELGLRLESKKMSIQILHIDHAERPSVN